MRKLMIAAATVAALSTVPAVALAQDNTAAGVAVGAGTGFLLGGPPGALIGGIIGGTVGATNEQRYYGPRARYYRDDYVCWRDDWGRRVCDYR